MSPYVNKFSPSSKYFYYFGFFLRMYSEKISLDLEEEKKLGMQLGC